jgi:glycosyltransferase involved in cell wall biosynthesis
MATQRVSLCMIVKNEEGNLPSCLGSVADLVSEIVVVDTGSTDGTKQIAAQHGARVVDVPWRDSFAEARNESIDHATGDWIFWLDADDLVDDVNRPKLRSLLGRLGQEPLAYFMWSALVWESGEISTVDHVRLFRNLPQIRWKYRVHEQLIYRADWLTGVARASDIVIRHAGYFQAAGTKSKMERNLRLLELDLHENARDPAVLFHLGWTYLKLGRPADALPHLQKGLSCCSPTLSIVRLFYLLLSQAWEQLGRVPEALAICRQGRERFAQDPELQALEQRLAGPVDSFMVQGW